MALISVISAKGAPGATTTAMLLANLWPAATYLVDADPLGGDVALRLRGEHGPLDPGRGLMSLLPAVRRGLEPAVVAEHTQAALGGQPVLAGLAGPEQAVAVAPLWNGLAQAFTRIPDVDVVADLGQTHSRSTHLAMAESSAAVLCVYRPTAWSAVHTRHRLESLAETLRERDTVVGIVCVAGPRDEANSSAAARGILADLDWVADYGVVAHDRDAVAMYEGGAVYRPERTLLVRSGATLAQRLHADLVAAEGVQPAAAVDGDRAPAPVDAADTADTAVDPTGGRRTRERGRGSRRGARAGRRRKEAAREAEA